MSIMDRVHSAPMASLTRLAAKAFLVLTVAFLPACGGGGDGASAVNASALAADPVVSAAPASADLAFIPHAVNLVNDAAG